jgi:hypothetical protein
LHAPEDMSASVADISAFEDTPLLEFEGIHKFLSL